MEVPLKKAQLITHQIHRTNRERDKNKSMKTLGDRDRGQKMSGKAGENNFILIIESSPVV